MHLLRRAVALALAVAALAIAAQLAPAEAQAKGPCKAAKAIGTVTGGIEAVTGVQAGLGNPVSDVCKKVSGALGGAITDPLTGAVEGIGNGIFEQVTRWVSDGAVWLIGEVVKGIERTTTPKLTTRAFVSQYRQMAQIAALLGLAMLLLAVLEGAAQGNAGMLVRVALLNLPLAFIATSVAYVVVQLLLVATDGLCDAIAAGGREESRRLFEGALTGLGEAGTATGRKVGGQAGEAAGAASVPLFVSFLAAIVGAFAAFLVWLELLMRDAAVYVVALFMPFSLAASIQPRWSGVLRRTAELLVVLIGSKFVIVSIIALAAGLLANAEGRVEPVLAASALMLLACFAPFVLLRFVPFAEGAMTAAYNRHSAAGGISNGVHLASHAQMLRGMARSNWSGSGVELWEGGPSGGENGGGGRPTQSSPKPGGGSGSKPGSAGRPGDPGGGSSGSAAPRAAKAGGGATSGSAAAGGGAGAAAGSAAGPAAAAAAIPVAATQKARAAAQRLGSTTSAQGTGSAQAQPAREGASKSAPTPQGKDQKQSGDASAAPSEKPPRPPAERPPARPGGGEDR